MTAVSVQPAYPSFTGVDGKPIDNGYIWIGLPNLDPQTHPAQVYWDAELTMAAPQPIRTMAGYPSRTGTPTRLYVDGDYSIRVLDKNGALVYSSQSAGFSITASTQLADYAELRAYVGDSNSVQITGQIGLAKPAGIAGRFVYDPADTTTPDDGGRVIVDVSGRRWKRDTKGKTNPDWFGADPTGISDTYPAFIAAVSKYDSIEFGPGRYRFTASPVITANREISIEGAGQGVTSLIFENSSGIVVDMSGFTVPREFSIRRMSLLSNSVGGTALTINRVSTSSIESGINLQDLTICGFEGAHDPDKWFERAIDINNSRFITIDNVRIWGREFNNGAAVDGIRIRTSNINQAQFQVFVNKLSIANYRTGFRVEGNVEGIYWNASEIFACRNPLIVDRTGATLAGTVLIGEAHFNGSGDVMVFKNVTTVGISNTEAFHGFNESGGPFGSSIITIEGGRNNRIVGSKITSSLASIPFNGVRFIGVQESFIGGATVIRGFSRHGIDIATSSNISIDGVRIIGNSGTDSRGIVIDADSAAIDIGHAPTTQVLIGLVDNSGKAAVQYRDYTGTEIFTMAGGSPVASIDIPIPAYRFTSKPNFVAVSASTSTTNQSLLCNYHFDAPESTATNARVTVRTADGSNILAGPKRFVFTMKR